MASVALASDDRYNLPLEDLTKKKKKETTEALKAFQNDQKVLQIISYKLYYL